MVVKMRKSDLLDTINAIAELLQKEDSPYKFNYALIKNKAKLRDVGEELGEMLKAWNKSRLQIILKYCEKDEKGKAVMNGQAYCGLSRGQQPEYDKEMDEHVAAQEAMMKEEFEFEPYVIEKEWLPEKIKGTLLDGIMPLFKSDEK